MIRRRVVVHGFVQGVFFRGWTQEQAERLGVNGWVRNCPDGSVEAHLSGEELAVQELVDRLHGGPPAAIVSHVDAGYNVVGMKAEDAPDIATV